MDGLDPNLIFVLGYGIIAVILVGVMVIFYKLLTELSANTNPAVTIEFANSIKDVANAIITQSETRAKETETPLDDLGVAGIRIVLSELIKMLPADSPGPPLKGDEGGDMLGEFNEERGT